MRAGVAVASVLLVAGLAGCGASGPSDTDRTAWQTWASAIVDSAPDATVSGTVAGGDQAPETVSFASPTEFQSLELRCIGTDRAEFSLTFVAEGQQDVKGDLVVVLEAMKLEQPLQAHKDGVVGAIDATPGTTVSSGHQLLTIS